MEMIKSIATGSIYEVPEMTEDKNFVKINLSAEVNKLRREKAAKTIYLIKKAWYDYLDNAFGYSVVGFVNTIDEADKICNGGGVVNYGMDHPEYISQEIKYYDGSEKNYQIEPFPKETRNPNMVIGKQFYSIEDIKKTNIMITETKPQFSEQQMWDQQTNTSTTLQSRNEHIMERLHDIVIAIQTTEVTGGEVKEEWVCEMADLVELYHELNFDKFIQKYENQGKN